MHSIPFARSARRRLAATMMAVLLITTVVLTADSPAAHAEACSDKGHPQRVNTAGAAVYLETLACVGAEWKVIMAVQIGSNRMQIFETPTEPEWKLDVRSLFDLSTYDPVAAVEKFREALAAGTALSKDEQAQWKLAMANVAAQANIQRGTLRHSNAACKTRSRMYTEVQKRLQRYWSTPASVLPSTEPSTITYSFEASVTDSAKAVILSAVSQYAQAVDAQDAAFAYPRQLVYEPDASKATIRFSVVDGLKGPNSLPAAGLTVPDFRVVVPGFDSRWTTGEIRLDSSTTTLTPFAVGHEIGHVLGINHLPSDVEGTMASSAEGISSPWTPHQNENPNASQAFDDCMFLPAN